MTRDKKVTANRTYKSSLFVMVFQEKKELLELYNAVSGKHYEDPEELETNTLDNAIYMSIKNDLSFIIDSRLSLYEHQSTYNPNLPLRCLFYVADIYSKIALHKDIYGSTPLSIPSPPVCDLLQWRAESAGTGDHAAFQSLYSERRAAKTGTGSSYAEYPSGA